MWYNSKLVSDLSILERNPQREGEREGEANRNAGAKGGGEETDQHHVTSFPHL